MAFREGISWQLILADLALILFLVAISTVGDDDESVASEADVPAQAIYRPRPDGPDIDLWLDQQTPDPRMTLTIVATHLPGDDGRAWRDAKALAAQARRSGIAVKIVTRDGPETDLYARLGFDNLS